MPLDWDILLDSVSIKDQITSFNVRESKGSYVREITLVSADPEFYNQFSYTDLPSPRVDVLTKSGVDFVSQGTFYIEKPILVANEDGTTSPGVWGRSSSAAAGPPFAQKISQSWETDTNFIDIVNEVAALSGMTVTFEVSNYAIVANTYVADNIYPIDVITELAAFTGAYVACTNDGNLVIKQDTYHPSVAVQTLEDINIADLSENQELPDFGNRIRISALGGTGSGYSVNMEAVDDDDCLPADGTSQGTLLAFVNDSENNAAPDNTMVNWEIGDGATLAYPVTATQNYVLSGKKHEADNFYEVTVDYPIQSVVGIWAYSDSGSKNNFWEPEFGSIDGNKITVRKPFSFCDQLLRITYVTAGCAVNTVIAGDTAKDVEVSADVEGATDTMTIKLGNTCACGSNLNMKANPSGDVCLGNLGHLLVWATIGKVPATGQNVRIRITKGCGVLSSENKVFKNVEIRNEASFAENIISGTSQVKTEIDISGAQLPSVYAEEDTGRSNNLYSSYSGKVIDLNQVIETGTKVLVSYHAEGATLVSWRTLGEEKDCDAEITASMSDGTESGLFSKVTLRAKDCSITDIPDSNEDWDEYDPGYSDYDDDSDGGFEDDGNGFDPGPSAGTSPDPCLDDVMNRILNADNATSDEERDGYRFGTSSSANCPDDAEFDCSCDELCNSEVREKGNTYDHSETIHDTIVADGFEKGTPEYNEEFNRVMEQNVADCSSKCESQRLELCGDCDSVVGPTYLANGESAEYVCSNGVSEIVTMPEDQCGTYTTTVGCCEVDIRSSDGTWVCTSDYCGSTIYAIYCDMGTRREYWNTSRTFKFGEYKCPGGDQTYYVNCGDHDNYCGHPCPQNYPDANHNRCMENVNPIKWYEWEC